MQKLIYKIIICTVASMSVCAFGTDTQVRYRLTDLGSGRWQYTYDLTNCSLDAGIEEFTIWFDYGLYENLAIATQNPPAVDWDEIIWQPDPVIGSNGGYDGLVEVTTLAIGVGQTVSNFSVSFDWLGQGTPGSQFYEIVNPVTFEAIDSGYTMPATILLLTPNGGEDLMAGSQYTINWSNAESIIDVLIEYSSDNGLTWMPVSPSNTGNTGSYNWILPWVNSNQCIVCISDAANPMAFDVSDTPFTIWRPIFVDVNARGNNDGSDWGNAYNYLQDALANRSAMCHEIRIAKGTYTPDSNSANPNGSGDRNATFQLLDNVTIKGGYGGFGESDPNLRDPNVYKTILSGDLNGDDGPDFANYGENSYHVVTGTSNDAALDGVTITAGYADGGGRGSAIYGGNQTISNCIISRNYADAHSWGYGWQDGAGAISGCDGSISNCKFIENYYYGISFSGVSPVVSNCSFLRNNGGGIILENYSSTTLNNCTFSANNAGISALTSYGLTITNCTFSGNNYGIFGSNCFDATLTNCTFSQNDSGIYGIGGSAKNCILWDLGTEIVSWNGLNITYSDVRGGWLGEGNIDADPLFLDPLGPDGIAGTGDEDLHLLPDSPCIDAGDPNSSWENEPWPNGARINMGAYGNTAEATQSRGPLQFAGFEILKETRLGRNIFRYDLGLSLANVTQDSIENVFVSLVDASTQVTNIIDGTIVFPVIEAENTADSNSFGDNFAVVIDHSQFIGTGRLTWQVDFSHLGAPRMLMMSASLPMETNGIAGDITGDGKVDYSDLAIMAEQWLQPPGAPSADIVPAPNGDGVVNFLDFAKLAENWMK